MASNVEAGDDVVDDDVDFWFLRRFIVDDWTVGSGDFFEQNLLFERSCSWGEKLLLKFEGFDKKNTVSVQIETGTGLNMHLNPQVFPEIWLG